MNRFTIFCVVLLAITQVDDALGQENCYMAQVFSGRYYGTDAELNDISTCIKIDLEDNRITFEMVKTLADALSQTAPKLKTLNMKDTTLTDEGVKLLLAALEHRPNLKTIDFSNNDITATGAAEISSFLRKKGVSVENIQLAVNSIGDEGAVALAQALQETPANAVTTLVLRSNKIGADGMKAFAAYVLEQDNKKLVELNLKYNKFEKSSLTFINMQNHIHANKAAAAEKGPLKIKNSDSL